MREHVWIGKDALSSRKAEKTAFMSNVVNLNTKPLIITKKGRYMA